RLPWLAVFSGGLRRNEALQSFQFGGDFGAAGSRIPRTSACIV
ncbi:hypothetical protein Csa_023672, partial [Cucumis sativus]